MNPEWNEGQEEVGEVEVVAGRGKAEEGQRPTGGMKPSNRSSRQKRRTEAAKALASQLSAAKQEREGSWWKARWPWRRRCQGERLRRRW